MKIRKLKKSDVTGIVKSFGGNEYVHQERFSKQESDEGIYLVAVLDNAIVGYVFIYWKMIIDGGERFEMYLKGLHVHSEYLRIGIASKLLEEVERIVLEKEKDEIYLDVEMNNTVAIHLYSKCSFVVTKKNLKVTCKYKDDNGKQCLWEGYCYQMKKQLVSIRNDSPVLPCR